MLRHVQMVAEEEEFVKRIPIVVCAMIIGTYLIARVA